MTISSPARDTIRPLTNPNPLEENALVTLIPSPTNLKLTEPESRNGPGVRPVALEVVRARKVFQSSPGLSRRLMPRRGTEPAKAVVAVDDVSLSVYRGEIFGILGPNGTGKSTLIRLVSTLLLPDSGLVRVFGLDVVAEEAAVKRLINRVSVEAAFFKKLSPMENLLYAARLYRVPADVARREATAILTRLGLKERAIYEPMEDMSRGMQQKVAIARAFLTAPVLLLLDEPTTGLDPRSKLEVQAFVRQMRDDHDTTVLLTTHDMAEAEALCDRIAIFDHGRIVALDTPERLKRLVHRADRPATLEDVFLELTGRSLDAEAPEQEAPT
jgi:ABC-2 type transport system ATP-binding protein